MPSNSRNEWRTCCGSLPRDEIVFFAQVFIAYMVIIVSLINLCISNENTHLWVALASGTIGYLFPAPSLVENVRSPDVVDSAI